jgi:hypothetical protein
MVLSLILLVAGFIAYGKFLRYRTISSQQPTLMESRTSLVEVIGMKATHRTANYPFV